MQEFLNSITLPGIITGFVIGALFTMGIARLDRNRDNRK